MTITQDGGEVLGIRPLASDGIEPELFLSQPPGRGCLLQRGYTALRTATEEEQQRCPVFPTWGYRVIKIMAEMHFGGRSQAA